MKQLMARVFVFFLLFGGGGGAVSASDSRSALFVLVNEANASVPCSEASVEGSGFSDSRNLDGWLNASSHGERDLAPVGNGTGESAVVSISGFEANGTVCDIVLLREWAPRIFDVVLADNPSFPTRSDAQLGTVPDFDHVLLVFPDPGAIAFAGGPSGCPTFETERPSQPLSGSDDYEWLSWVFDCDAPIVYARALGGNFGFLESSANDTADVGFGNSSTLDRTPNAPSRVAALWLRPDEGLGLFPDFSELLGVTPFILPDLALPPVDNATVTLQIRNLTEPEWLYVSCRQDQAGSVFYDSGNGVFNGTSLHVHARLFSENETSTLVATLGPGGIFSSVDQENLLALSVFRDFFDPGDESCSFSVAASGFQSVVGTVGHLVFENSTSWVAATLVARNDTLKEAIVVGSGAEAKRSVPGTFGSFVTSPTSRPSEFDPAPLGPRNFSLAIGPFSEVPSGENATTTVVDDADSGASAAGPWTLNATSPGGFFGTGYALSVPQTEGNFTFDYPFVERRWCEVRFYWTSQGNQSVSNVEVRVFHMHPSGSTTDDPVFINQGSGFPGPQGGSHAFATLGTFHMDPSASKVVVLSKNLTSSNASVSADAVEFACDPPWNPNGTLPLGTKTILVIPVDPDGSGSPIPCDALDSATLAANLTSADSFGRVDFTVAVAPVANLSGAGLNLSACDYHLWAELALNATTPLMSAVSTTTTTTATNGTFTTTSPQSPTILGGTKFLGAPPYFGLEVPDFDVIFVLLPSGVGSCPWDLLSAIGHPVQVSTRCDRDGDLAHALGHAFGLGRSLNESGSAMGTLGSGPFNVPQRSAAGWLTPDRVFVPPIENTTIELALLDAEPPSDLWDPQDPPLAVQIDALGTLLFVSCRPGAFHVHEFSASGFPSFPPVPGRGFNFASVLSEVFASSLRVQTLSSEGEGVSLGSGVELVAQNVSSCLLKVSVPITIFNETTTTTTINSTSTLTSTSTSTTTTVTSSTAGASVTTTTVPTTTPTTTTSTSTTTTTTTTTVTTTTITSTTVTTTTTAITTTTTTTTTMTITTEVSVPPPTIDVPLFVWILIPVTACGLLCVFTIFVLLRLSGPRRKGMRRRRG